MANEGLIIDVDYNITKAEAKQRKLNREFEISKQKAANITKEIQNTEKNIADSIARQKELDAELDRSANKLESYEKGNVNFTAQQFQQELKRNQQIQARIAKEEQYQISQQTSLARQNVALDAQNAKTTALGEKIILNSKKQNIFANAFQKSAKSAALFGKRVFSLIRSALIFSLITKAFTKLREAFGKMINEQGTETTKLAAQLKGNLAVIGTTIYESVKPAIESLLRVLVQITNVLANGLAKILGKNINQMKELTKQTKKAGKEAKGSVASFDQINTVSSSEDSSDSGVGTDFGALNSSISDETALLMTILSGALLVLGVILAFSGIAIPLGIGLIAIGAVGLVGSYSANPQAIVEAIQGPLGKIMAIIGLSLLAIGILLLLIPGVGWGWGLGLILAGAATLAPAVVFNWNAIVEAIRGPVGKIMAIIGASLLLLGILLLFIPGIGWGLGLGLILAGAAALGTTVAFNWDAITEKVKSIASKIGKLFKNCWDGIKKGFKAMVNGIISFANLWIDGLNLLLLPVRGLITGIAKAFGSDIKLSDVKIPHIPKLATGAVLPGGSPMLAWVNDQPKGQTYVEGSVDNIVKAFEQYLSGRNFGNTTQDNRPIILQVDGKEIARATRSGENKLGNQTVFGGFANVY